MMAPQSTREFLSQRVRSIKQSPSNHLSQIAAEMKARGRDIVSFAQGEPDFPTPEHIKQAAVDAMRKDFTHYTTVDGI
ncbi:MAG: aspartate transaminase, partial [Burkholderiales bacterium]